MKVRGGPLDDPATERDIPPRRRSSATVHDTLFRDWFLALTIGEVLGFVAPAVAGVALATAQVADGWMVLGLTLAGMVEGLAIGTFGARVLGRHLPGFDRRGWITATTLAAGFAWFVGMGGSALLRTVDAPVPVLFMLIVPAWVAGLLSMGWAQWLVMRRVVRRSSRWIWVSAGAWLVGVAIPVVALSLAPNGWSPAAHVAVGVLAATAMGATVAALTGRTLRRLVDRCRREVQQAWD